MYQYFAIITLALGPCTATSTRTLTTETPMTRLDIWTLMRRQMAERQDNPQWMEAATVFFSAEPNQIGQ